LLIAAAFLMQACVTVQDTETVTLEAGGVGVVTADIERGDLVLVGEHGVPVFNVETRLWGRGSDQDRAGARQDDVTWGADLQGDRLVLRSSTTFSRSGVDMNVDGPDLYDTSLVVHRGSVRIEDVEGFHSISAPSVRGTLIGDVDILASGSVDIDFIPWRETEAIIENTDGSVQIALPFGLDYDLTIRGDVDEELIVADLGFDRVDVGNGFFSGIRGRGDVEIDIIVDGGRVEVVELR
jgi:hypothetical protein